MQESTQQDTSHALIDLHAAIASLRVNDPDWRGATSRVHAYKRRQQHVYVTRSADIPPDCAPHSIEHLLAKAIATSERSEARVTALAARVAGERRGPPRENTNGTKADVSPKVHTVAVEPIEWGAHEQ